MRSTFHHLSWTQRLQIEAALKLKTPIKRIAELVGVHISTVYREIKRGRYLHRERKYDVYGDFCGYRETERYSPDIAQRNAEWNAASKGAPLKIGKDHAFAEFVEHMIADEDMSPDAVLGFIRRNALPFTTSICRNTLYSYIEKGVFARLSLTNLKEKGKKKKRKKRELQAAKPPRGTSIEKRPPEIVNRAEFGHWEMDCVCGPTRGVLLVLTERQTRREILMKMKDQCAASVVHCLNVLERKYGKAFRKIFKIQEALTRAKNDLEILGFRANRIQNEEPQTEDYMREIQWAVDQMIEYIDKTKHEIAQGKIGMP